jgi:hypothetical protein
MLKYDAFRCKLKRFETNDKNWIMDKDKIQLLYEKFGGLNGIDIDSIIDYIIDNNTYTPKVKDFWKAKKELKIGNVNTEVDLELYDTMALNYARMQDKLQIGGECEEAKGNFSDGLWILEKKKQLPFMDHIHVKVLFKFARKLTCEQWKNICNRMETTNLDKLVNCVCSVLKAA